MASPHSTARSVWNHEDVISFPSAWARPAMFAAANGSVNRLRKPWALMTAKRPRICVIPWNRSAVSAAVAWDRSSRSTKICTAALRRIKSKKYLINTSKLQRGVQDEDSVAARLGNHRQGLSTPAVYPRQYQGQCRDGILRDCCRCPGRI